MSRDVEALDLEDLADRIRRNYMITGFGPHNTTIHLPCPFCGAGSWLVHRLLETKQAYAKGATCKACGRSAKFLVEEVAGGTGIEAVHTGGPDQLPWMQKMRDLRATNGSALH